MVSMKPMIKVLSMMPRSFENLLIKIPDGVVSKKWQGLRIIALIIFS